MPKIHWSTLVVVLVIVMVLMFGYHHMIAKKA